MTKKSDEALGPLFDTTPFEREDGSLDDSWVDAFLRHSAMRAVARQQRHRLAAPEGEESGHE